MPHSPRVPALAALLSLAALGLSPGAARAGEVDVMISGGFKSTYQALLPGFEAATGDRVTTLPGPSMGTTADAIPVRLARGEPDDVLIMVGSALDALIRDGEALAGSKVDLALSPIGAVVRAGAPVPDISTIDGLRAALLAAKSIAYSDSASGVYVRDELFRRLGIEAEMRGKARMIPATPVAEIVARGEAELGFQQVAELLPIPGVAFAGRLPEAVQRTTVFSAGIASAAKHPEAGRALIAYMSSPAAAPVLERMGLEPAKR